MKLIAMSGYARSGKDEAAAALAGLGYTRLSFADVLRNSLYALNPIIDNKGMRLQSIIDVLGWNGYKISEYSDEIRALLQRLGTDAGRNVISDSVWVDATFKNLNPAGKYVVSDCRFPNECQAVMARGGEVWRIERPGIGPANNHFSEVALDNWNFDKIVLNDGTLEEFHAKIKQLAQ